MISIAIKLVSFVKECSLEETLGQTDVSSSYKFDVDLVPGVQTLHQQTDAVPITARSFCVAYLYFILVYNEVNRAIHKAAGLPAGPFLLPTPIDSLWDIFQWNSEIVE